AHGKYCRVGTPKVSAINIPEVDHGIKGIITVPESSSVLDKFLGCKIYFIYVSLYNSPGIMIGRYVFAVTKAVVTVDITVIKIKSPIRLTNFNRVLTITSKQLAPEIIPANVKAHNETNTTFVIEFMPPRSSNLVISSETFILESTASISTENPFSVTAKTS